MKTITIKGVDYKIKQTIRAFFVFEKITGKQFKIESMLDNYLFFYSIVVANNMDTALEWDDFIDALDTDPNIMEAFTTLSEENSKMNDMLSNEENDDKKKVQ